MTAIALPNVMEMCTVEITAICTTCKRRHTYSVTPDRLLHAMSEWDTKHQRVHGCETAFYTSNRTINPEIDDQPYEKLGDAPWWLKYKHNTDFKLAYGASAAVTNAIQSLATSSTWLAGYESDVLDNTSNKYIDNFLSGKTTVGTTPTASTIIEHSIVTMADDSTWPDVFDGTTSAETITSAGVKNGICVPLVYLTVDATTSDRAYWYTKRSLASLFGGFVPPKCVVFTSHNTGVNLNSTGGNQVLTQQGVYMTGA